MSNNKISIKDTLNEENARTLSLNNVKSTNDIVIDSLVSNSSILKNIKTSDINKRRKEGSFDDTAFKNRNATNGVKKTLKTTDDIDDILLHRKNDNLKLAALSTSTFKSRLRSLSTAPEENLSKPTTTIETVLKTLHEDDDETNTSNELNEPLPAFKDITEELHYYVKHNMIDLLKVTLEKEKETKDKENKPFNISNQYLEKDTNNCTLLHKAAANNRFKIMGILIEDYRALIEKKDTNGSTPLFYAVANNCVRSCAYLLTKGAKPNAKDNFETTPLYLALKKGYIDIAKTLILFGADVNYKTQKGATVLHLCCEEGSIEKVDFLLEHGASITRTNRDDQHCLFSAAPHPALMEYLCRYLSSSSEEEATLRLTQLKEENNILITSTTQNNEIANQNKKDLEVVGQISFASTVPASKEKPTLIKLVNRMSSQGMSIVHYCAFFGYLASLKVIVNYLPAESMTQILNEKEKKYGDTPLHVAVRKNQRDVAQLLARSREVDVDAVNDHSGDTPLHLAINNQNQEMVTILVAANCSTVIKNHAKLTAKQTAKKFNLNLKVEEEKQLRSLKSRQSMTFFQKFKSKFKKEDQVDEKKRHTLQSKRLSKTLGNNSQRFSRNSSSIVTVMQDDIEEMIRTQPYLKWSVKFEFNEELNIHHKEIFYIINKLYFYWVADQHSIQIQISISDLIEKSRKFFEKQEHLMKERNFTHTAFESHKHDHDLFLKRTENLLHKINTEDYIIDEDEFTLMSTWWVSHIIRHDKKLVQDTAATSSVNK
ncbi:hypothetical protein ABK040_000098 [Willaertia magna]